MLWVCGCFGAKDNALFLDGANGIASAPSAPPGGAANAQAGTDSSSDVTAARGGGGAGGTSGVAGSGAASGSGGTDVGSAGAPIAGGGESAAPPRIESCSMLADAVVSELDGHCYRVTEQELSFAEADRVCVEAGGHLVNIGSAEENEWVAALHDGEHWLGATDGRTDMVPGVGPYTWMNGETWTYADWEDGQPNAFETDCPNEEVEGDCYEHCAFQTDEGDWNDRSCWHTIPSVCEWDVAKLDAPSGGRGSADEP